MLINMKLSQLASLLPGLIAFLKPGAGDVALLRASIFEPSFFFPAIQEFYASTSKTRTLTIDPNEYNASETPPLSSRTDVSTFVQTYELEPYYGITRWPAYKDYLRPSIDSGLLSSCTDLSTVVRTYELQPYYGFTPWLGYNNYLDHGPDSDDLLDTNQGVSVPLTQEPVDVTYGPLNINSVSNISAVSYVNGLSTLLANTTRASVSDISAAFSVNGISTLPARTIAYNDISSIYITASPFPIDAFSRPFMLPFLTTSGDFLVSPAGMAVDALNIKRILPRDIPVKNSSASANRTILRVNTITHSTQPKSSPAVKLHRQMPGGLTQRNRLNYPSDSDLCILALVYMVLLLTFVTVYTYTPPNLKPRRRKCKRNKCGSAKKARARATPPAASSL